MTDTEQKLREDIASRLREGLIKDFNKLYVKEYTTTWELERVCRKTEIDIMSFDNAIKNMVFLLKEYLPELAKENGYVKLAKDQSLPPRIRKMGWIDDNTDEVQQEMLKTGFRKVEL